MIWARVRGASHNDSGSRTCRCWHGVLGGLWLALAPMGCFDSDDRFRAVGTSSGGDPQVTTTGFASSGTSSTGAPVTSTGVPDVTCRGAIQCVFQCAALIQVQTQLDPNYEPDLGCFLDCEEELTVPEALKLLRLGNCTSMVCADMGECESAPTTTGGTDSGDGPLPAPSGLDPCINCIFVRMIDAESPGCEEFAMACQ